MSESVQVWSVFAYRDEDGEIVSDERRRVTEPLLAVAVDQFVRDGFDNIYLHCDPDDTFKCEGHTVSNGLAHFWHHWPDDCAA